ncbi:MAG: family 1 glycosylhydrolase [Chthoniobacterales bacterium]
MTTRILPVLACILLVSGCVNPIDPLGKIGKGPQPRPVKPKPNLSEKFAWGISTASYQYEDPAVKPGDKDYFQTDWDISIAQGKAPPKGNALYSWTHFDKDLEALKKIGVTHYRFSIEWARVEPQPGVYNEAAIRRYAEMARKLKAAGIEPVVCLWHFTFPSWLYDKKHPAGPTGFIRWLAPIGMRMSTAWCALPLPIRNTMPRRMNQTARSRPPTLWPRGLPA